MTTNNIPQTDYLVPKVSNMTSPSSGSEVPNQFIIETEKCLVFQSYRTIIAVIDKESGLIYLDEQKYDYSRTTSRYRNQFLSMNTKEVQTKIEQGSIILINLNDNNYGIL